MSKSETEKRVEDMPKTRVRLTGVASYNHLEEDRIKHDGDIVDVEEGRARALIQQGSAEPVQGKSKQHRRASTSPCSVAFLDVISHRARS